MENPLEEIIDWLDVGEAADYKAGLALLERYCKNRSLLNQLQRKDSANNREKLRYELIKSTCGGNLEHTNEVLNQLAEVVKAGVPDLTTQLLDAHRDRVFPRQPAPEHVPEAVLVEVDELTQLMARLYNQRCQLSNGLADLDVATDGPRVVGEILSLQNQYNALAEKRRRLVAGEPVALEQPAAPEPAADVPIVDRGELVKQRQNLRSNISKARKKLETATSAAKQSELEQKIGQLTVELANLDMQLALPQA